MTSVSAVSPMHEYVHQRAQEKRQPDECTQHMGAVLGEQQHPRNNQKADQHQPCRRGEKATLIAMAIVVVQRHWHPSALIRRRPSMISGRRTLLPRTDLSGARRPAGVCPSLTPSFCPPTSVILAREPGFPDEIVGIAMTRNAHARRGHTSFIRLL